MVKSSPVVLTVAGSDPSGGAGIQADLLTCSALGVHAFSVIAAIIAQNSFAVAEVEPVRPSLVVKQVETLIEQQRPAAIKTGVLGSAGVVTAVAQTIERLKLPAPVIDPVFVASAGARLLDQAGERALRDYLAPLGALITPNLAEAQTLSGVEITDETAMLEAAQRIRRLGVGAVLIKGGHLQQARMAIDLLLLGSGPIKISAPRLPADVHGTGCIYSAAVAAYLARGLDMEAAVRQAKRFVTKAIAAARPVGKGRAIFRRFKI